MKKDKFRELFLDHLRKVPIVQVACEKVGVSRNSVYRWKKDDVAFAKEMETALEEGEALVNDMSESQLITLIREKNWHAISFWLRHRNPKYRDRLEVTAKVQAQEELTEEQAAIVKEALRLASLIPEESSQSNHASIQTPSSYEEATQPGTIPETSVQPPSIGACGADDTGP
jgi:hypothetical protein